MPRKVASRVSARPGRHEIGHYIGKVNDADEVPVEHTMEKSPLVGAAAMKTHLTLAVGLALCVAAFWFELDRAEGGNELSWAYVFEWPLLAAFGIYMWWKILHPGFTLRPKREKPALAPEYEGMLHAWQEEVHRLEETRREEGIESAPRPDDGAAPEDE